MALEAEGSNPSTHPIFYLYVGVSPSGKARDFDSRTRRFKSCHPSHKNSSNDEFLFMLTAGFERERKGIDS